MLVLEPWQVVLGLHLEPLQVLAILPQDAELLHYLTIGKFGKLKKIDMKKLIIKFVFLFSVFSIGLFFGEWLLDVILNSKRDTIKIEAMESVIIGFIVALLIVIGNKSLKKNK